MPNLRNNSVRRRLAKGNKPNGTYRRTSTTPSPSDPAIIGWCRRCGREGLITPYLGVCVGTRVAPGLLRRAALGIRGYSAKEIMEGAIDSKGKVNTEDRSAQCKAIAMRRAKKKGYRR